MIVIFEDDVDWEAFHAANLFNPDFYAAEMGRKDIHLWISPEAYAKEVVLADLRARVEALPIYSEVDRYVKVGDVLALLDVSE